MLEPFAEMVAGQHGWRRSVGDRLAMRLLDQPPAAPWGPPGKTYHLRDGGFQGSAKDKLSPERPSLATTASILNPAGGTCEH